MVRSGAISRVTILINLFRGLITPITTPEPPSKASKPGGSVKEHSGLRGQWPADLSVCRENYEKLRTFN